MTIRGEQFVWTATGGMVHISDDLKRTRCGFTVFDEASADQVIWFWPPCKRCRHDGKNPPWVVD